MAWDREEVLEAARWARGIEAAHRRIGARFYRSEPRRRALAQLAAEHHQTLSSPGGRLDLEHLPSVPLATRRCGIVIASVASRTVMARCHFLRCRLLVPAGSWAVKPLRIWAVAHQPFSDACARSPSASSAWPGPGNPRWLVDAVG